MLQNGDVHKGKRNAVLFILAHLALINDWEIDLKIKGVNFETLNHSPVTMTIRFDLILHTDGKQALIT